METYVLIGGTILLSAILAAWLRSDAFRKSPFTTGTLLLLVVVVASGVAWKWLSSLAESNPPGKDLAAEASVSSIEEASVKWIATERIAISDAAKTATARNADSNAATKERFRALDPIASP